MADAVGEGVMEKFRRANMHREDFESRVAGFVNRRPHQITALHGYEEPQTRTGSW